MTEIERIHYTATLDNGTEASCTGYELSKFPGEDRISFVKLINPLVARPWGEAPIGGKDFPERPTVTETSDGQRTATFKPAEVRTIVEHIPNGQDNVVYSATSHDQ